MGTVDLPARFEFKQENGGVVRVRVSGNITDFSDLTPLTAIDAPHVVIDLEQLVRINSRGVMLWKKMIETLCTRAERVEIHNATHAFIHQYITVHNFIATATLESLLATYVCNGCGSTSTVQHERATDFQNGRFAPRPGPKCSRCQAIMVPDDPVFELYLDAITKLMGSFTKKPGH